MHDACGDEDHIPAFTSYVCSPIPILACPRNTYCSCSTVLCDAASRAFLHGEFPQGKVRSLLRGDQHLDGRILSCGHVFRFHIGCMFDSHGYLQFIHTGGQTLVYEHKLSYLSIPKAESKNSTMRAEYSSGLQRGPSQWVASSMIQACAFGPVNSA